jgi:hypothetical protein
LKHLQLVVPIFLKCYFELLFFLILKEVPPSLVHRATILSFVTQWIYGMIKLLGLFLMCKPSMILAILSGNGVSSFLTKPLYLLALYKPAQHILFEKSFWGTEKPSNQMVKMNGQSRLKLPVCAAVVTPWFCENFSFSGSLFQSSGNGSDEDLGLIRLSISEHLSVRLLPGQWKKKEKVECIVSRNFSSEISWRLLFRLMISW